jgi:hypothetical protein
MPRRGRLGSPADVFYGDDDGITVDDLEQDPVNAGMDTPVLAPLRPLVRFVRQQVNSVDHLFRTLRVVLVEPGQGTLCGLLKM